MLLKLNSAYFSTLPRNRTFYLEALLSSHQFRKLQAESLLRRDIPDRPCIPIAQMETGHHVGP